MSKTAVMFAGQGSQVVGMGRDLAEQFPTAKALFEQANGILGFDVARVCFHGPEEELTQTDKAQPGIFLVSWAAYMTLKERLPTLAIHAAAGLSLGEFTALAAAGVFTFEEALKLVHERGRFMQEACEVTEGSMAAVIGLDLPLLKEVCVEAGVEVANLNCPGQIVISGDREKIVRACELAKAKGAKRALPLPVAGAYHSRLMASAQPKLEAALAGVEVRPPALPVISNVTALPHTEPSEIQKLLVQQVTSSVLWEDSMRYLIREEFTTFIELGPGTALSGFMKRIAPDVQVFNIMDRASLKSTVDCLIG